MRKLSPMGVHFMRRALRVAPMALPTLLLALWAGGAHADLTDPVVLSQLNPLEQLAAKANQAVYNALTTGTGAGPICAANATVAAGSCTGNVFNIFSRVRELVDTANALDPAKGGSTLYSLGDNAFGLGQALRWTAAEELSAQGTSSTQFSNGQLATLANRLAAIRQGSQGFHVAMNNIDQNGNVTYLPENSIGGAAGADSPLSSPWGGFLDGSYGYGSKSDTTNSGGYEDAYAFDDTEISGGIDYRFSPHWVAGAIFGYSKKRVEFNPTESTTDGHIHTTGGSLIGYAMWENDQFFASGSIGYQRLDYDFLRRIAYPSFNVLVSSVNETASSSTSSNVLLSTLGAGYDLNLRALTIEPYVNASYQRIDIAAFTETQAGGFDFNYATQVIKSLDGSLGLKLQYVFTPPFGVIVPYIRGELHKEFDDKDREVSAVYAALSSVGLASANANFDIPTDQRKDTYGIIAGGLSVVFKHGLQAFVQYQQVVDLTTVADRVISGGLRYEF